MATKPIKRTNVKAVAAAEPARKTVATKKKMKPAGKGAKSKSK
jgi:hypothetical protein